MYYEVMVKNIFNDMYLFFNGKRAIGLEALQDAYQDEPLFLAFISDLPEAFKVSFYDVMMECYGFFKKYCGKDHTEEDWADIVKEIREFREKWNNTWSWKLILALLEVLEREEKERKEEQEKALEGTATEETGEELPDIQENEERQAQPLAA